MGHVPPQKYQHMPPPKQQKPTLLSLDRQHAPVTYGNIQPQNIQVSIPPPQHRPMPSQQNIKQQQQQQQQYYQHHPGHYPPHQANTSTAIHDSPVSPSSAFEAEFITV